MGSKERIKDNNSKQDVEILDKASSEKSTIDIGTLKLYNETSFNNEFDISSSEFRLRAPVENLPFGINTSFYGMYKTKPDAKNEVRVRNYSSIAKEVLKINGNPLEIGARERTTYNFTNKKWDEVNLGLTASYKTSKVGFYGNLNMNVASDTPVLKGLLGAGTTFEKVGIGKNSFIGKTGVYAETSSALKQLKPSYCVGVSLPLGN